MLAQESCTTKFTSLTINRFFLWKSAVRGKNVIPTACCMNFGWFELVDRESGTNWTQFSMSHDAHCSCKPPAPLQHRNEPMFASYATVCVFGPCNVSPQYMYTRIEDACAHNMPRDVCSHLTIYRWDLVLNPCRLCYLLDKRTCLWGCLYGL